MSREDFWSRRKAAVAKEEAAARDAEREAAEAEAQAAREAEQAEKSDEEILAELDLPDPETLQPGDDIRGFMARAVPDRLRRRALRQLWKLNPVLANVDGLVDYGEDFTDAALVVENLQTTYQVGRGMLAHVEEMARQAEAEAQAETDPETPPEPDAPEAPEEAPEITDEIPQEQTAAPEETVAFDPGAGNNEDDVTEPRPRRMRFTFEG